jgi:hypothetical protein
MKKIILILLLASTAFSARPLTDVGIVNGNALHTMQNAWLTVDETTSAGTEPTALGEDERKKSRLDIAIAAAASGDDEISTFLIPPKWNILRFRSANVTKDSGNIVYDIYLGTLGGDIECDLVYAGQLNFTSGDQDSSYYQIGFTSGGTYTPKTGDTVTGNTSGETAIVVSVTLSSGAWADGDAAGTIQYRSSSGTFTNSETVNIVNPFGVRQANVLTHAASDLVVFEWADTLVVTAKSWGASWSSVSPADDTIAEAELDVKGADFLVALPSTCDADGKLLVKGY